MTKDGFGDSNRILTIPGPGDRKRLPPHKLECHDIKSIMQVAGGYLCIITILIVSYLVA